MTTVILLSEMTYASAALAFPGADGFARHTIGGRGGDIYIITSLEDEPKNPIPGTLRHAISAKGPRIITFQVSGVIHLKSRLVIKNSHVTIAGQSSPGGIVLRGAPFVIKANQVILRYLRFRLGLIDPDEDAASARNQQDIIIDHCSFSWSIDEVASFYNNKNFTLQYSIIAQSLNSAGHDKGVHGYGGIWGGAGATFHHNVIAHNNSRNPRIAGYRLNPSYTKNQEFTDISNNIVYNWKSNSAYGGENSAFNFIDNMYIMGPASKAKHMYRFFISSTNENYGRAYFKRNQLLDKKNALLGDAIKLRSKKGKATPTLSSRILKERLTPQNFIHLNFQTTYLQRESVQSSYHRLINNKEVGANRNASGLFLDSVDTSILTDIAQRTAKAGTLGIIDSEFEVISSWEAYAAEFIHAPADHDKDLDGMPDAWEASKSISAPNKYDLDPHYTNIEVYLNHLGAFK